MNQVKEELKEIKDKRQYAIDILNAKICPYCGNEPEYIDSKEVYGKSYGMMYRCDDCDAHVGVHEGTSKPLGRLADKELRTLKSKLHDKFDPLWEEGTINEIWPKYIPDTSNRAKAYKWLANELQISEEFCHIGMFSKRYCKKAIKIIEDEANL